MGGNFCKKYSDFLQVAIPPNFLTYTQFVPASTFTLKSFNQHTSMKFQTAVFSFVLLSFSLGYGQQSPKQLDISSEYLIYLPEGYDPEGEKNWPLMFFLHGAGERGDDIEKVKVHGPPKLAEEKKFPFIVVSPQCPQNEWWDTYVLNKLYNEILSNYRVDKSRVYLTGLSMGGFGTWEWAAENPEKFAAIAPICGGGNPHSVWKLRHIPTRVFHGDSDNVVPLKMSDVMVDALAGFDADVEFTVYPDVGHDSWTETYDQDELYEWFLSHSKTEAPTASLDKDAIEPYLGQYEHPEVGKMNVELEEGKLFLKINRQRRELTPEGNNHYRGRLMDQVLISFSDEGMTVYMNDRVENAPRVE